jgi:hypothetical protein
MLVVVKIRFFKSSTDHVLLLVCAIQSAFLIQFNIALQMHNFILSSV